MSSRRNGAAPIPFRPVDHFTILTKVLHAADNRDGHRPHTMAHTRQPIDARSSTKPVRRMNNTRFTLPLLIAFLSTVLVQTAAAQNGPPPHVASAVDAVAALARSTGDGAISHFIGNAMDPAAVGDRAETAEHLASIRDAVSGLTEEISVEDNGSGPVIIFISGDVERHVRLDVSQEGIRALTLVTPAPNRVSGRDGAVRGHIRAIEGLADAEFPAALERFDEDHFAPLFLEMTTSERRMKLLRDISTAASNAGSVAVDFDGRRYVIRLTGLATSEIVLGVQDSAPWKISHLELRGGEDNPE